jgi:hypothetical protein
MPQRAPTAEVGFSQEEVTYEPAPASPDPEPDRGGIA